MFQGLEESTVYNIPFFKHQQLTKQSLDVVKLGNVFRLWITDIYQKESVEAHKTKPVAISV